MTHDNRRTTHGYGFGCGPGPVPGPDEDIGHVNWFKLPATDSPPNLHASSIPAIQWHTDFYLLPDHAKLEQERSAAEDAKRCGGVHGKKLISLYSLIIKLSNFQTFNAHFLEFLMFMCSFLEKHL